MEKTHREILRRNRVALSKDIEPEKLIIHMTEVLTSEDEEDIRAPSTRTGRVLKLLDILKGRGGKAFGCFLEALDKQQPHLAELLRKDEAISLERVNSANLRQQLTETKIELEKEKAKNMEIQAENENLKGIQIEKLDRLNEQILKTEDNLKKHFEGVLKGKAKEQESCSDSHRSSLLIYDIIKQNGQNEMEDENGNIVPNIADPMEKLNMELQICHERKKELESECKKLRDKVESMESTRSGTSTSQDKSTSPIQQVATDEDSETCKKCKKLELKCADLQNHIHEGTKEIRSLTKTITDYENKTLQNESLEKLKIKQTELKHAEAAAESWRNQFLSKKKKLEDLRKSKKALQEENKQLLEEQEIMSDSVKEERKKSAKEKAGLQKIAEKVQKECGLLKDELERWKSLPGKVFNFKKEFGNGVIHTLIKDSQNKRQNFPFTAKRSSDAYGNAIDIFKTSVESDTNSCTENKEHSWWQIDLGEDVLLFPNHYELRHGGCNGLAVITNWKLEGSRDGNNWKVLKEHKKKRWWLSHKQGFPFYTGSWTLEGSIDAVRYLRIYQTDTNSGGNYALFLSGIEVYGVLVYMC